ncbi:TIGR03749 family integrating conjugative element protein (plasmid) [Marinobacter sp. NP-4(2019)]|uniref:TIGR03749 family integrating conjugative element protein n=1 Tax=Marinobacter sp. NP-4(2019) TaxID=2488665 RepID=UPI000FC3CBE4|nr:TIGR03749 family integrating conjugative element protein [Marinobacter sp. NP-4(2019)]AZT86037.1 TIGR03749 family integrating conjugative element protein [Marinobacter sp. NP-4(2019)]
MRKFIITSVAFLCVATSSWAEQIIHYDNLPVTIELHNGEERSIQFGSHVQVGITKGQQVKKLFRAQSAQGAVHFLPYEAFDKQRVQIRRMDDGKVILLDLIATDKADGEKSLEDVRIVLASDNVVSSDDAAASMPEKVELITPIDLTRYAAQRLYGPTRLHHDQAGISETPLAVKGAVRIFKGPARYKTLSTPVVAYQGGGYYLAALYIRNVSDETVQLDYLDLNLPFSHATLQHHSLEPQGTPGDSTVLYLISEQSLKETLYPWTYYQDLKRETQASVADS